MFALSSFCSASANARDAVAIVFVVVPLPVVVFPAQTNVLVFT